jgi:hypothetical protein
MGKGHQEDEEDEDELHEEDSAQITDLPMGFDEERATDSGAEVTESAEYEEEEEDTEEPQIKRVRSGEDGDAA